MRDKIFIERDFSVECDIYGNGYGGGYPKMRRELDYFEEIIVSERIIGSGGGLEDGDYLGYVKGIYCNDFYDKYGYLREAFPIVEGKSYGQFTGFGHHLASEMGTLDQCEITPDVDCKTDNSPRLIFNSKGNASGHGKETFNGLCMPIINNNAVRMIFCNGTASGYVQSDFKYEKKLIEHSTAYGDLSCRSTNFNNKYYDKTCGIPMGSTRGFGYFGRNGDLSVSLDLPVEID
jgi:hypothetical protein